MVRIRPGDGGSLGGFVGAACVSVGDLRRGGLVREARRRRECAEEGEAGGRQEEDVQRRKSPRVAGLEPGPGLGGKGDG